MRILLFGGTGRTGKLILEKALNDGHNVTTIARDPSKLDALKVRIIKGTPYDPENVKQAMCDCDVVISTLNVSRNSDSPWSKLRSPKDMISKSIRNALNIMPEHGIKRIIAMSTIGAGDSWNKMPFIIKLVISSSSLRHAFKDHTRQEEILAASGTNWTIVRFPVLTDENGEKEVRIKLNNDTKLNKTINRESAARFILNIINDERYFEKIAAISN